MNHPGQAIIEVRSIAGRSALTRAQSHSPLRLLMPRSHGQSAWVFTSSYGGGLVSGDHLRIKVHCHAGASCMLSTQATTKVYRTLDGAPCRQELAATLESDSLLALLPDPVSCFKDAKYEQHQRFDLAADASLVLMDGLNCGRAACGERWRFARYISRNEIWVDDRLVLTDAVCLDPADGPLDAPHRLGSCEYLALVVLVGPRVREAATALLAEISAMPVEKNASLLVSASTIAGGVILRAAAKNAEQLARFLRQRLSFIGELLGEDPWSRKW